MKLLTQELRERLPQLYATREEPDPIAQVRFVSERPTPTEWYAVEYDGRTMFYGLIACSENRTPRLDYFSLGEITSRALVDFVNGGAGKHLPCVPDGLRYDTNFDPKPVTRIFPGVALSGQSRRPSRASGFSPEESHR